MIFLRCYKFTTSWDGTIEQPSLADDLVAYALTFEGYDYVYGGTTPAGFDCSGFVQLCLPPLRLQHHAHGRTSQYYNDGEHVSRSELMPGDLVFFGSGGEITHVGIYIGGGTFSSTRPIRARASSSAPERELLQRPLLRREPHHFRVIHSYIQNRHVGNSVPVSLSKKSLRAFFVKLLSELQNQFLYHDFAILPLRRVI